MGHNAGSEHSEKHKERQRTFRIVPTARGPYNKPSAPFQERFPNPLTPKGGDSLDSHLVTLMI